jgi:Protein of unknown function (DUF2975)
MKALGSSSLASRLTVVLDLVIIGMIVIGALNGLLLLSLVIEPTSPTRRLLNVTTLYNVPPAYCDASGLLQQHEPGALVETRLLAYVNYRPGSRWGVLGVAGGYFVVWGLYLLVVVQLRRVFDSLASEQPFLRQNVARLRLIGWAIIASAFFRHAWNWAAVSCMRPVLTLAGRPPTVPLAFIIEDMHLEVFFVGAAVLVLAEIFRAGAGLQEDQALTV